MEKHLRKCEELAVQLNEEKLLFRVELLKNMEKYSGWKDLWISENDTPVSPELIAWCKKYHYYNHLAYIYLYSFNSDYRKFSTTEGMQERIPEFNMGIEIAERLGNYHYIHCAYMKNIMLASIHGYFDVCIQFYNKAIVNAKEHGDELIEAGIYNGLGYSNCGLGQYEEANKYYNSALNIFYHQRQENQVIETLYNMGINAILAEEFTTASVDLLMADSMLSSLSRAP